MRKNQLANQIGVTPAAVSQYELGQTRPAADTLAALALALALPAEFFTIGPVEHRLPPSTAHFRSIRATTQLEREQALAFGQLAWELLGAIDSYVELPPVDLPDLDAPTAPAAVLDGRSQQRSADPATAAIAAREHFGLGNRPVPHVIRLLESRGVLVLRLPTVSRRVDAFSHVYGQRPCVFLNPAKGDKPRARFDASHELGHLLMHHDTEPGSRLVENAAHAFAAEFLTPAAVIRDQLPSRLDWDELRKLKRHWGVSLKALLFRAHSLGVLGERPYRRGLITLNQWGDPEPESLGAPEEPTLLSAAASLLGDEGISLDEVGRHAQLPPQIVDELITAGGPVRRRVEISER